MKKPPSESDFERYSGSGGPGSGGSGPGTGGGGPGGGEGHNMEKYAQENLNIHTRGLLRKKVPVMDMISWTKVRVPAGRGNSALPDNWILPLMISLLYSASHDFPSFMAPKTASISLITESTLLLMFP